MSPSNPYTTTNRPQACACEQQPTGCGCVQQEQESCGCQNPCFCRNPCVQSDCDCVCRSCPPVAQEADVSCGCDCAGGLLGVLQLLCDERFSALIDYARFAFITDHYILGSSLSCPDRVATPYDNLTGPLAGELTDVSAQSCRRLGVAGQIYDPIPACALTCCADGPGFAATELSLCSVRAIAFSPIAEPTPVPADPDFLSPFQRARSLFYRALHPGCPVRPMNARPTPCDSAPSVSCTDLDCRRTLSLTAGPLVIGNAAMLGRLGDAYVLANDDSQRFYVVCADSIDFVG